MLGLVIAVAVALPVGCPWATYPLPPGARQRIGDPAFTHGPELVGLAFSPDGSRMATATTREVVVRCAVTGRRIAAFDFPGEKVYFVSESHNFDLAFSPDGRRLLATGTGRLTLLCDLRTGRAVSLPTTEKRAGHPHFLPDGSAGVVAEAEFDGLGEPPMPPDPPGGPPSLPRFRPLGAPSVARLTHDAATGQSRTATALPGWPVAVAADGARAVFAYSTHAQAIEIATGKAGQSVRHRAGSRTDFADADARLLVTMHADGEAVVRDPAAGKAAFRVTLGEEFRHGRRDPEEKEDFAVRFALSPDGKELAAWFDAAWYANRGTAARRWRLADGKELPPFRFPWFPGRPRLTYSPDGKTVAGIDGHGLITTWDRDTGRPRARAARGRLDSDGGRWLVRTDYDPDSSKHRMKDAVSDRVRVFDAATGRATGPAVPWPVSSAPAVSPDGKRLAGYDSVTGRVLIADAATGKELRWMARPDDVPADKEGGWGRVAFVEGGAAVVVSHPGRTVECRDADTGARRWAAKGVGYALPSADGRFLFRPEILTGWRQKLSALDPTKDGAKPLWAVEHPDKPVGGENSWGAAVSPDGKWVVQNAFGGLTVYDAADGAVARRWRVLPASHDPMRDGRQDYELNGPVFSADGTRVAVAYRPNGYGPKNLRGALEVWEVATGTRVWAAEQRLHDDYRPVAFAPDGRSLWVAPREGVELLRFDTAPAKPKR